MADSLWLLAGVAIGRQPSAMSGAQSSPIIVKIIEPKKDTLADVLIGSLGLTGVLVLCAVVAAVIFGAVLFWVRSKSS